MRESGEQTNVVRTHAEGDNARLNVDLALKPKIGKENLKAKYGVAKYDLTSGFTMGEALRNLVPRNTPEYVEKGERYVERMMRALYHFKQCALIGPSGTGKSICEGEQVFVVLDGRPLLTTVDGLFERLARKLPVNLDQDGWEIVALNGTDLQVLSVDVSTNDVTWKRPYAIARSMHRGDIVEVTTERNRSIRATPRHSFITDGKEVKAGRISLGTRIPIIRRVPGINLAPLVSLSAADYTPGAKVTERGVIVAGGRESIQIPAPAVIRLNEEFSWFLGFFVAEGSIGRDHASVGNKNSGLIERCSKLATSLGLATMIRKNRGLTELRVFSRAFVSMLSAATLTGRVGTGKGSQARYKRVPDFVFAAPESARIAFLRGFFEGDGWQEEGAEVLLGTSSRDLANGLVILCEQLGLFPTVRVKKAKVNSYLVVLARDGAARLGIQITGLAEQTDFRGHVEKIMVTPELIALAKRAYRRLDPSLKSKSYHKRTVSCLYSRSQMIGLRTLLRIARELNSRELERVAESDIIWDPIKEVRRIPYDGWVYDFQVPGTETFAAGFGGVLTHNTHVVYLVAELAGLPLWEINCGLQTSVYDLFGRFVGLGKENWIDGQIVSWCRYGGILYLDEANMMKQDVATRLNPLLDTRGHLVLTERDNEIIPRHSHGYVIISMNPYSAEFAGTKPLNAAFRRRMSVWIDFDYLSEGTKISQDEVDMIARRSGVTAEVSEKIVRVAAEIRRRYKAGDLPYGPSVGDLLNWATLVADGLSPAVASEETIIALTSDDAEVQNSVRRIIRMVFGDARATPS